MSAVLLSLLAATCFAAATVLQHRAASGTGLRALVTPGWVLGLLLGGAGVLAHALALRTGGVVVVQPLLLTGVVVALPLGVLVEHRRPTRAEWSAALALAAGLAVALLSASPDAGASRASSAPLVLGGGVTAVGCALLRLLADRLPAHRAALLGAAGGTASGLAGVLLEQATGPGPRTVALGAFALAGTAGLVLTTQAYAAGPLASSLPALAAAEPAVAVLLGSRLFGEHLAGGLLPRAGQLAGCAVVLLAARALGRAAVQEGDWVRAG